MLELAPYGVAVLAIICAFLGYRLWAHRGYTKKLCKHNQEQDRKICSLTDSINGVTKQLEDKDTIIESYVSSTKDMTAKIDALVINQAHVESLRKSSETRLGLMAENFMPFIKDYPYDHKRFRFLANPIDGLQVTDDALIFIEFKTGGARLSRSQKHVKQLVHEGRVRFETFRVNDKGTSLKIESDMGELDEYNSTEEVGMLQKPRERV